MGNKIVFVTGGASGIGFGIGKAFAESGAEVFLSDINKDKVSSVAESLKEKGLKATPIACDVINEKQLGAELNKIVDLHGRLDVLVNNAGIQYIAPIEDFPTEKFQDLLSVLLIAPFMAIKHVFPLMKKRRFGRIINMASINGLIGFAGKVAYNSAKHGIIGLTKVAALEGAPYGITVNAICPGYVDTPLVRNQLTDLGKIRGLSTEEVLEKVIYPLVPQRRLLNVEEIANYVLFLAGNKAHGITGQAVVIDGGYTVQ